MINIVQQLKDIVPQSIRPAVEDVLKSSDLSSNAEVILKLCKIVTRKIDIVERQKYFPWIKGYGTIYAKGNKVSEKEEEDLMIYGTQLIYLLRTFIHNEEITFHMASKTADGKYNSSAFVPQSDILRSLSALKNGAVGVELKLQRELIAKNEKNKLFDIKRKNMWTRVEYLSEGLYLPGKNIDKIDVRKSGAQRAHWAYQNQKKDILIYLKFTGKRMVKYYDMDNSHKASSLMEFNNGWLWEWYNKILHGGSDAQYSDVTTSLMKKGSLRPIMLGKDWTPGTKEGDFQDLQGRQIQSKYANDKIISFNNIRHVIYDLESALTLYFQEAPNANENLTKILQEHFYPESISNANNYANDSVKDLLERFNLHFT